MKIHLLLPAVVAAASGCFLFGRHDTRRADLYEGQQLPPVSESSVRESGAREAELPDGVTFQDSTNVAVQPPNRVVGRFRTGSYADDAASGQSLDAWHADVHAWMRRKAAAAGANALVPHGGYWWALRLEEAPRAPRPAAADLLSAQSQGVGDYRPLADPIARRLDGFAPVTVDGRRGACYVAAFALDQDAEWSPVARNGVTFKFQTGDELTTFETTGHAGASADMRALRANWAEIGCPTGNGPMQIDLWAYFGSAQSRDRVHDLGAGGVVFQVYSKPISEEALREKWRVRRRVA
jgi:hypothetical protein